MTVTCQHGWPRDGWPCPFRKCIDAARTAYTEASHQPPASRPTRTPEDDLIDALRAVWAKHPDAAGPGGALVEYAQVTGRQVTA